MTKRVSDLTKEELDYWVAKMQGLEIAADCVELYVVYPDETMPRAYHPSTNGGQAMELVERFKGEITYEYSHEVDVWCGSVYDKDNCLVMAYAKTPMEAICRAVIASHYGDEVPDDGL